MPRIRSCPILDRKPPKLGMFPSPTVPPPQPPLHCTKLYITPDSPKLALYIFLRKNLVTVDNCNTIGTTGVYYSLSIFSTKIRDGGQLYTTYNWLSKVSFPYIRLKFGRTVDPISSGRKH